MCCIVILCKETKGLFRLLSFIVYYCTNVYVICFVLLFNIFLCCGRFHEGFRSVFSGTNASAVEGYNVMFLLCERTSDLSGLLSTHKGLLFVQAKVEKSVGAMQSCFLNIGEHGSKEPILEREKHIAYLRLGLKHLPEGYVVSFAFCCV